MTNRLQNEIKQSKPFDSMEEEVFLNLLRTSDALQRQMSQVLKPHGLSSTQYNVLRILRGAGSKGLTCGDIADRMITRDPDITRLLDRMEKRGLIERCRESKDRRVITARITQDALKLLDQLDKQNPCFLASMLGHLSPEKLTTLSDLLEEARSRTE